MLSVPAFVDRVVDWALNQEAAATEAAATDDDAEPKPVLYSGTPAQPGVPARGEGNVREF